MSITHSWVEGRERVSVAQECRAALDGHAGHPHRVSVHKIAALRRVILGIRVENDADSSHFLGDRHLNDGVPSDVVSWLHGFVNIIQLTILPRKMAPYRASTIFPLMSMFFSSKIL